jgi:hypothetical protein
MVIRVALGCRDTEAGRHLLGTTSTLEDAIKVAKTFEMSKSATGTNKRVSQVGERSPTRDPSSSPSRDSSGDETIMKLWSEVCDALKAVHTQSGF